MCCTSCLNQPLSKSIRINCEKSISRKLIDPRNHWDGRVQVYSAMHRTWKGWWISWQTCSVYGKAVQEDTEWMSKNGNQRPAGRMSGGTTAREPNGGGGGGERPDGGEWHDRGGGSAAKTSLTRRCRLRTIFFPLEVEAIEKLSNIVHIQEK